MRRTIRRSSIHRLQANCKVVDKCDFIAEGRPLEKVKKDFERHVGSTVSHEMYKDSYIVTRAMFCPCGTLVHEMGPPSRAISPVPGPSTAEDDVAGGIYEGLHIRRASDGEPTHIIRVGRADTIELPVTTCRRCIDRGRKYENDDQTVPDFKSR